MDFEERIKIINDMSADEVQELSRMIDETMANVKFIPFPGTQTRAYFSDAKVMLYGGKPGGGKSALIAGLALQEHYRSLLIRRNHSDLRPLIDVAKELNGSQKGFVGGGRPEYKKSGGGVIHFMGLSQDGGLGSMQGEAHDLVCVGRDTPVLMGDGSYKAIQDIVSGDIVRTLEGRASVKNVFKKMHKDAVEVKTPYGSQIQSTSHSLMTSCANWSSYHSLLALPTQFHIAYIVFEQFYKKLLTALQHHEHRIGHQELVSVISQAAIVLGHMDLWASSFCKEQQGQETCSLECYGQLRQSLQHLLLSVSQQGLFEQTHELFLDFGNVLHFLNECGAPDVWRTSSPVDYLLNCLEDSHLYDERIHEVLDLPTGQVFCPLYLHRSYDAGPPIPIDLQDGVQDEIHKYTFHRPWFCHPYKMHGRPASEFVSLSFSSMSPVGKKEVYDIHVEGVNHYITAGGFINKNCVDEVAQITEDPVRTVLGWLRPTTGTPDGQRLRVVMGSNPPLDSTGDWLTGFFPCWLDDTYPNPAKDGEIRWFIRDGAMDVECKEGDYVMLDGERVQAHSRTFIASDYNDNPYINAQEYLEGLSSMSEEQRKILMSGNFLLSRGDAEKQLIPTKWIQEAQARWSKDGHKGRLMESIGADVTGSGTDKVAISPMYEGLFFGETKLKQGSEYKGPSEMAADIVMLRRGGCPVGVDMGGGYGGGPKEHLSFAGVNVHGFIPNKSTMERTADKSYGFTNLRDLSMWRLREALDPSQDGGSSVALPPSKKLLSDLATPKFTVVMHKGRMCVKVESKDEIKKRIRRSPDEGDSVAIALWTYMYNTKKQASYGSNMTGKGGSHSAVVGHANRKRRNNK